ncbi:MAG TPA: SRPBCC family protein [Candidatus Baltobacteraceae bacterium]|nr:SRPBCC family protein [Candidatus Baltobacteraceae bacterium]
MTRNAVDIAAPAEAVYALGAATERWPELLPHYRYVRVLERRGEARVVAMGARHGIVPLSWTAEQTNDPRTPRITFRHVRGWTRGMDVEWRFDPIPGGTRVTIEHRLRFEFPLAAEWLGRHVVSDVFIHGVASRTLARMKAIAEGGA